MKRFRMWLRGIEVEVEGYIEAGDRSVGIIGDAFLFERITRVVDNVELYTDDTAADWLSDDEQLAIDCAYWEQERDWSYAYSWRDEIEDVH